MIEEKFKTLLNELELFWKKKNSPILKRLQPGTSTSKLSLSNFSGKLPKDFEELYNWKNGVYSQTDESSLGSLYLFELGLFLTLRDIVLIQAQMTQSRFGWDKTKIPIFESGGGEYFLLDCDEDKKESYGLILYHSFSDTNFDKTVSIYDSLYTLFKSIYECHKCGVYSYDEITGILTIKEQESFRIQKALNPNSKYWYLFA